MMLMLIIPLSALCVSSAFFASPGQDAKGAKQRGERRGFESCINYCRDLFKLYSVRSDLTGFATAAFIACVLIVIIAMSKATQPAIAKTHHPILMRYA